MATTTIDTTELADLRKRAAALEEVVSVLWDQDHNDWRELNSCADAIDDITGLVQHFTPPDDGERIECGGCGESWQATESDAHDRNHFCSRACERAGGGA